MLVDEHSQAAFAATEELAVRRARHDVNAFIEFVLRQNDGARLIQEELHRAGQTTIDRCIADNAPTLLLWPREHGKTTQVLGRVAWEIGRSYSPVIAAPRFRFGTVRYYTNPGSAEVRTKYLRNIILSPAFQRVFPGVALDGVKDNADSFNLVGNTSLDWTFSAHAMTSSKAGGRATLLGILDDVVDATSMVSSAHRAELVMRWDNDVANILSCPILAIGTRWHREDLWGEFTARESWRTMIVSAHDAPETGALIVRTRDGEATAPLLERMGRTREWYSNRRRGIGPAAWSRQFGQSPDVSEFQKFREGMFQRFDVSRLDFARCALVTFVDPAGGHVGGDTTGIVSLILCTHPQPAMLVGDAVLWRAEATSTPLARVADRLARVADAWTTQGGRMTAWRVECETNGGWESGWAAVRREPGMSGYPLGAGVKHSTAKEGRIETLAVMAGKEAGAGRLWIADSWETDHELALALTQLWDWPNAKNDDFPDALAAACELAGLALGSGGGIAPMRASRPKGLSAAFPRTLR